jgi:hypothetical protein
MSSSTRQARALLAAAGLLLATGARGAEVAVSWDAELAPPEGRATYEARLRAIVEEARARVVAGLGLEPGPGIAVAVHTRAAFEARFGADAARLDLARFVGDTIHVNGGARLDDRLAGVVVHELCHAALDSRGTARSLPRWLDEGLAERLSWQRRGLESPAPNQVAELRQARERKALVPLPREGELSRLDYLRSWAAVVFLEQRVGRARLLAVVRATLAGEPFDRALARELSLTPEEVDRGFDAWVGGL